jgi:hypothetical protein
MSKKSRRQGRPTVDRDPASFLQKLQQHRRVMNAAAARWDSTHDDDEVIVMATCLRTLLGPNDFLLNRVLPVKRGVLFLDGSLPPPGPSTTFWGVGGLALVLFEAESAAVRPAFACAGHDPQRFVRFHEWWEKDKPAMHDQLSVSRQFLVLETANTDAIHVDVVLDAEYDKISRALPNWKLKDKDGTERGTEGFVAACIRQIAWELERTLAVELALRSLESIQSGDV